MAGWRKPGPVAAVAVSAALLWTGCGRIGFDPGDGPLPRIALRDVATGEAFAILRDGDEIEVASIAGPTLVLDHRLVVEPSAEAGSVMLTALGDDPDVIGRPRDFTFSAAWLRVGANTLAASAFPTPDGTGEPVESWTVDFTLVLDVPETFRVTSLRAVDASTLEPVAEVVEGGTLTLSTLPSAFALEVVTDPPDVGACRVETRDESGVALLGRTEGWRPYTNTAGPQPWEPLPGTYTVAATPFSTGDGTGVTGNTVEVTFDVVP